jgi:hypothetical protein
VLAQFTGEDLVPKPKDGFPVVVGRERQADVARTDRRRMN